VLREFARDYPTSVGKSARVVAKELKLSRTAYNNFVKKKTKTQDRVLRPIAELYLRVQEEQRAAREAEEQARREEQSERPRLVAEAPAAYAPGGVERELRASLPADPAEAERVVTRLFEQIRERLAPDEITAFVEKAKQLLLEHARRPHPGDEPPAPARARRKRKK